MRTSTADALHRLRAADPADGLPVTDATQLDRVLTAARQTPVDDAEVEFALPVARRRRTAVAAVAASLIVLALATVIGVATRSQRHPDQASHPSTTATRKAAAASPEYPDRAEALQQIRAALPTLPTVPGAREQTTPPVHELRQLADFEGVGKLLVRTRFWTAPGTAATAIDYLEHHAPPHTRDSSSSGGGDGERGLDFSADPGRPGKIYISYRVVDHAGGVAIRADVENLWYPRKTAAETIGTVTSVDVVVRHGSYGPHGVTYEPTVRRSLTGARAQRLAAAVDAAPIGTYTGSCPPPLYTGTDRLEFHTASRSFTVINFAGFCGGLSLRAAGERPINLLGSVDSLLLKELGLPSDYGR